MIQLVIVACMLSNPTVCREKADFDPPPFLMTCVVGALRAAAEWVNEHPGWFVKRTECRSNRPPEKSA